MQIFHNVSDVTKDNNTVLTLGTFDGVHKGHSKILDKLKERAAENGARTFLITFHPHPKKVVANGYDVKLLTTTEEKTALFEKAGIDNLLIIEFTKEFSQLSSGVFFKDYIIDKIGLSHIVLGYDHHFGKNRGGDELTVKQLAEEYNFGVDVIDALSIDGETVSSTKIREALLEGNVKKANKFLGRLYSFNGVVVEGDKRGRELGFPTANIQVEEGKILPGNGIYAVNAVVEGKKYNGLLSLGVRPTFYSSGSLIAEVYMLDFNRDIYGKEIKIELVDWIRNQEKFSSAAELISQMNKDKEKSLQIFNK